MNRVLIVSGVLVLGMFWLGIRQERLACRMEVLQAENRHLSQALAQKEEFNAVSRRLENAEAFMNAVEGRLTNASMLLTQLQIASKQLAIPGRTDVMLEKMLENRSSRRRSPIFEARPSAIPPPPRTPVSSHSPAGELLARSWGPEQVVGPPNTFEAGDYPTAWAPYSSQGGQDEWLQVNYERAVEVAEVRVHETYNPGAVARLAAVLPGGGEAVIWEGVMPGGQAPLDTAIAVPAGIRAQSVKIYFDRTRAPGWNEIDAVELVARDGSRQWATSATASSSFADR